MTLFDMEIISDFLHMGGYGFFIWSAYGVVTAVIIGLFIAALRFQRTSEIELDSLEATVRSRSQPSKQKNVDETQT